MDLIDKPKPFMPQWENISWISKKNGLIDHTQMPTIEQNKLRELMEFDIIKMFQTKRVVTAVYFEKEIMTMNVYIEDQAVTLNFFEEAEQVTTYVTQVFNGTVNIQYIFCDVAKLAEIIYEFSEYTDLKNEIMAAINFAITNLSLPKDDSMAMAFFREYIRKKAIYEEYGYLANYLSDPATLIEIYNNLALLEDNIVVVAPMLGDGIYAAVKYKDFEESSKFTVLNDARRYYGNKIGKNAQMTVYYYSDVGWDRLMWEIQSIDRMMLTVNDIESVGNAQYLDAKKDFLGRMAYNYEPIKDWTNAANNRDSALLSHYKNGGTKSNFNWDAYPLVLPAQSEESQTGNKKSGWDLIEHAKELRNGKMSGHPVSGGEYIPFHWFSNWHSLDYMKFDREGRIDMSRIRNEEDLEAFITLMATDIGFKYQTSKKEVIVQVFNKQNITVNVYVRDDMLMAIKTFEDTQRILEFMEPLFKTGTKIRFILNVCDPWEWENLVEEYTLMEEEVRATNDKKEVFEKLDLERYIINMKYVWFETYAVTFKIHSENHSNTEDMSKSMVREYYLLHQERENR